MPKSTTKKTAPEAEAPKVEEKTAPEAEAGSDPLKFETMGEYLKRNGGKRPDAPAGNPAFSTVGEQLSKSD